MTNKSVQDKEIKIKQNHYFINLVNVCKALRSELIHGFDFFLYNFQEKFKFNDTKMSNVVTIKKRGKKIHLEKMKCSHLIFYFKQIL